MFSDSRILGKICKCLIHLNLIQNAWSEWSKRFSRRLHGFFNLERECLDIWNSLESLRTNNIGNQWISSKIHTHGGDKAVRDGNTWLGTWEDPTTVVCKLFEIQFGTFRTGWFRAGGRLALWPHSEFCACQTSKPNGLLVLYRPWLGVLPPEIVKSFQILSRKNQSV